MSRNFSERDFFERLSAETESASVNDVAPASLKSRTFSALVRAQVASGPLLSLTKSSAAGHGLCVFEHLVRIAPLGEQIKSLNPCRICHARMLAEKFDHATIYWPNCPYVAFQKR